MCEKCSVVVVGPVVCKIEKCSAVCPVCEKRSVVGLVCDKCSVCEKCSVLGPAVCEKCSECEKCSVLGPAVCEKCSAECEKTEVFLVGGPAVCEKWSVAEYARIMFVELYF